MARLLIGVATCGQAPYWGSRLGPRPLARGNRPQTWCLRTQRTPVGVATYGPYGRVQTQWLKSGQPPASQPLAIGHLGVEVLLEAVPVHRGRAWRCQRDPRCRDRRSRCMVMRQGSDGTDDDEIDYHRAWRCADTHIVLVIGPIG
ncbi:hypothetical protein GW17_00043121 [Ensete ventricosum]|nr:hypothetical protein GW17_00043121 [Ensete ventricosum]